MTILDKVKSIRLIDYAQNCGFTLQKVGKYYTLKEHDSVRIDDDKNCFWRNSRFQRGAKGGAGTVIDFAMEFENYSSPKEAIHAIADKYGLSADNDFVQHRSKQSKSVPANNISSVATTNKTNKKLSLPARDNNNHDVIRYLCDIRKLDKGLVEAFIKRGLLYQDTRKNCVFVSPDKTFACLRSTGERKFVRDVEGSNYDNCFFLTDVGVVDPHSIVVTESVIDMMSVMSYIRITPHFLEYHSDKAFLALSGTNKMQALFTYIERYPAITSIVFALDKDAAGQTAVTTAVDNLVSKGFKGNVLFAYPPKCKDWNEYLQFLQA